MSKGLVMLSERLLEAEQQAGLALAKAQQDLKIFMEQQEALNQYRQIYHQQWTDRGLQGIGAQQNAQYHAFISKLEQAATQQYEGVRQVRQALELPAGKAVELKPGGYHVMLMDLKAPLLKGTSVAVTLFFQDAQGVESQQQLQLPVAVKAPGGAAGHTMSVPMQHHPH